MKVYRFLEKLMIDEMIVVQGWQIDETTLRTVHRDTSETTNENINETTISIVNWDFYQYSETTNKTPSGSVSRARDETTKRTHNRKNNTENDTEKEKEIKSRSAPNSLPQTIEDIVPEMDLVDCPLLEEMPDIASGSKRDIPERVRHLFDGDYGAFHRYMERQEEAKKCSTQ